MDLSLPRWEDDSTFDLDFHVRRYAEASIPDGADELQALFHTVGPIYERPFDESRPLWELIEIDRPGDRSAIFIRLHHAMADGVGGNAILAAITDEGREGEAMPRPPEKPPGGWPEENSQQRLLEAVGNRMREDFSRASIVAGAMGRWHRAHGHRDVQEILTMVPINLRPPSKFGLGAALGNRTTGVSVRLPIAIVDPVKRFGVIHERMLARKASPGVEMMPKLAELISGAPPTIVGRQQKQ